MFGRRAWRRAIGLLAILGPGLIAGAAGDDAGGIATYASIGAQYGYSLLWALILITVALVVVQEQVTRMAVVTGKGLAELIRENYGVSWATMAMLVLLVANVAVTVADFAGIAAAGELFGLPRELVVPVMAVVVWLIVVGASYSLAEKVFIALSAVLLSYVGAALLARPSWTDVLVGATVPGISLESGFLATFVGLVGTTITPYMLFYLQSSLADKGVTVREYARARADTVVGALLSDVVAAFIIICTAATLFPNGIQIETAEDAARSLEPLAGPYARVLFGVGLFGASMLATSVIPLSTAYAIAGAFGFERGVSRSWSEAPVFNGLYTAMIVVAAAFVLIPTLPLVPVMVGTQVLNGVLLPVILLFVVRLASDPEIMGRFANGHAFNVLAYGTTVMLALLSVALLGFMALGLA